MKYLIILLLLWISYAFGYTSGNGDIHQILLIHNDHIVDVLTPEPIRMRIVLDELTLQCNDESEDVHILDSLKVKYHVNYYSIMQ